MKAEENNQAVGTSYNMARKHNTPSNFITEVQFAIDIHVENVEYFVNIFVWIDNPSQ